jgi:hypothetical protein
VRLTLARDVKRVPSPWEGFSLLILAAAAVYLPLWLSGTLEVPLGSPLKFLGLACPLCGGTRAVGSLALGHFEAALRYNPLALLILAAMLYGAGSFLFLVLPLRRRIQLEATPGQTRALWVVVGLLFAANWAYVLISGMHAVPMKA